MSAFGTKVSTSHSFSKSMPLMVRERVTTLMRQLREGIAFAADAAAKMEAEEIGEDGRSVQHAVVVLDPQDDASKKIIDVMMSNGKAPPDADVSIGIAIVVDLATARSLVESVENLSGIPGAGASMVRKLDDQAIVARAKRGMIVLLLTCGMTLLACLQRPGVEYGRA